jgi:broad specificity phosphatase PhoE
MKIVRLIRHGESAANAGAATQDHTSIPFTDKGLEQARHVAISFVEPPELIVTSPSLAPKRQKLPQPKRFRS